MPYGINDNNWNKIMMLIANQPNVDEAILFGSRAKGNFREGSDIDVCIKGEKLTLQDVYSILKAYDDTYLLYKLDLLIYNQINEPALKEHIDRVGVTFFKRNKQKNVA